MLCKSLSNPDFRVFGRAIESRWYHIFDDSSDACEILKQILIKENPCNPNVEIRMYDHQNSKWELLDESSRHLVDRHFIPYHICMKGRY